MLFVVILKNHYNDNLPFYQNSRNSVQENNSLDIYKIANNQPRPYQVLTKTQSRHSILSDIPTKCRMLIGQQPPFNNQSMGK